MMPDYWLMACPADVSMAELPKDFRPEPLGARAEVRQRLHELCPDADLADPASVVLGGDGWGVTFVLDKDPVECLDVRVKAARCRASDNQVLATLWTVADALGCRVVDCDRGEFLDRDQQGGVDDAGVDAAGAAGQPVGGVAVGGGPGLNGGEGGPRGVGLQRVAEATATAWRPLMRQWHEVGRMVRGLRRDVAQRGVPRRYASAAQQLGSDRPIVRIMGLVALEQIGSRHLDQRRDVMEALCAYLRLPCSLADQPGEYQTRLVAQRVLARHLRADPDASVSVAAPRRAYWGEMDIDLAGATLVDADFSGCALGGADFTGAMFRGTSEFWGTRFGSAASFIRADFEGDASFSFARFAEYVAFTSAAFHGNAFFMDAVLGRSTFAGANFHRPVGFARATFEGDVVLREATFHEGAHFPSAVAHGLFWCDRTTFRGWTTFSNATFHRGAILKETRFPADAQFAGAAFRTKPVLTGMVLGDGGVPELRQVDRDGSPWWGLSASGAATRGAEG